MKPILFSTPMVKAILAGHKSQTRRVVKFSKGLSPTWSGYTPDGAVLYGSNNVPAAKAPYKPGDILWVRETWRIGAWNVDGCIAVDYKADGTVRREWLMVDDEEQFEKYWIQSSEDAKKAGLSTDDNGEYHWDPGEAPTRWRPSIFMPREASRLYLKVTDVRAKRVQDIIGDQCAAEGIALYSGPVGKREDYYRGEFLKLWDNLNAKRGFSWSANPWVWVISFEKTEKPEVET